MLYCRVSFFFVIATVLVAGAAPASAEDLVAKVQTCTVCHGANGQPLAPNIPTIWGQQENYLVKELHDYRAGDRTNAIMTPVAQDIAQPDTRAVAAYFAAQTWPASHGAAPASPPDAIAGKIAMCKACHGQSFEGGAPAPRLAGQSGQYLASAMNSYANGKRTNNTDMPKFMQALSEADRKAIADYLSSL